MQYISELISVEEMSKWKRGDSVLISAGTGKGKSHFILNTLREFAESRNEKILLLVPRTAIKTQFNQQLDPFDTTIIVETYQWLETKIQSDKEYELSFDYIVADESHYFLDDASFNDSTYLSFEWLLKQNYKTIFMSATDIEINKILSTLKKETFHVYKLQPNFSNIEHVNFFELSRKRKYEYVIFKLRELVLSGEKALVFINNLEQAQKIYDLFREYSLLIHSKDREKVAQLLSEEQFNTQFLITTSFLDSGVTFKDRKLKHLFIDSAELNTIMQMLGRKRFLDSHDTVTVHIRSFNNSTLSGYYSQAVKNLKPLQLLLDRENEEYIQQYSKKNVQGVILEYDNGIQLKVNALYYLKQLSQRDLYKNYLSHKKGFEGVVSEMFESENNYTSAKENKDYDKLIDHLRSVNDMRLFSQEDRDKIIELANGRFNGRQIRSASGLTGFFYEIGVPCVITTKRDTRRTIKTIDGERIENPNRFKTFWRVELNEELLDLE